MNKSNKTKVSEFPKAKLDHRPLPNPNTPELSGNTDRRRPASGH